MSTRKAWTALSIVVALAFLTGCSSGAGAQVTSSTAKVTLASVSGSPAEVTGSRTAHVGDVVETDSTGQAQLDYADGSLTRLGPDSKLTINELGAAEAQRTAVTVDVGQSWHRVTELVADGARYEVTTAVGVAAVKGTAFDVNCTSASACTITVIEGVVEFTTTDGTGFEINAYQRLVVPNPNGGDPVVTIAPADAIEADGWLSDNISADDITQAVPVEATSMTGEWSGTSTLTIASGVFGTSVGSTQEFAWTFGEPECAAECTFAITSSSGTTYNAVLTESGFTAAGTSTTTCNGAEGPWDVTIDVELERTDEATFTGTSTFHYVANGNGFGACQPGPDTFDETKDTTVTRS